AAAIKKRKRRKVQFRLQGMWELTLFEISTWKLVRYRASIKADPERVPEQKDRKKCADKAYREKNRHLLALKKWEKRKEANAQKGTKQEDKTSSSKGFQIHCGGTKMGM
ncbi:hypothetical protein K438DRAFT_1811998, partial [Mycena galopus ATCC 62051]